MSAPPNRQAVIVGLFVMFAVVALAGGILTIGRLNDTFTRTVEVGVVFDDVQGLMVGDNVWFSGLKVGTVKRLDFHGGSQVEARLTVDRVAVPHIPHDAVARIGSDGLIGNRIVVLSGGTAGGAPVVAGDILQTAPSVSMEQMKDMLQQNNQNLLAITTDLRAVMARMAAGQGTAGKLLVDDDLYTKLDATASSLERTSGHADDLTAAMATFAAKLNQEGHLPNDLVTDQQLYGSLTASAGDLQVVTEKAATLVTGLEAGVSNPNGAMGTLLHDEQAGTDLKATLSNLNDSSQLLSQDLEAIQHNFLLRGFFRKKAKENAPARATPPPAPPPAPDAAPSSATPGR